MDFVGQCRFPARIAIAQGPLEFLMLLALPLMILSGFALDGETSDDDGRDRVDSSDADQGPIP